MRKNIISTFLIVISALGSITVSAQESKKLAFTGAARGIYFGDRLHQNTSDSITVPRLNTGHVMVDLGMNIRPNKHTEIQGMVRVRNDYGGFWGSGVSFDVRQLYIKGVAGGIVRYQLGDINDKLTAFTLQNSNQEIQNESPEVFRQQTKLMNYDNFYSKDSTWRQQGAAANFALQFSKYLKEIQFHGLATRVRTTDFSNVSDRLLTGYQIHVLQSKFFEFGLNASNVFDLEGTSRNPVQFRNPVHTITSVIKWNNSTLNLKLNSEFGRSQYTYIGLQDAPELKGKFITSKANFVLPANHLEVNLGWKYVTSDFRSAGAQTKRINYNYQPSAFARFTNDQIPRTLTLMDLMREQNAYNRQISTSLMAFNPKYDNITPYGEATPNRQGLSVEVKYALLNKMIKLGAQQFMLQETRGEGTTLPRKFNRTMFLVDANLNALRKDVNRLFHISASFRRDQTKRAGEAEVPSVNLNTKVASVGIEFEIRNQWDVLFGYQQVQFDGFDFMSIRNNYTQIYNFQEWTAKGKEQMTSAGIRYRFSQKSSLSANYGVFKNTNDLEVPQNYSVNQFMLLYQMNF